MKLEIALFDQLADALIPTNDTFAATLEKTGKRMQLLV